MPYLTIPCPDGRVLLKLGEEVGKLCLIMEVKNIKPINNG
jgi:hypothetical protein